MADGVVYTGFDPEFGDRLSRLLALAKGEGYTPNLISGRRDAYGWPGMKGQSQAELYSQLGKPGGPMAAAPPGYSPHQYGVAGDVTGIPQSELERLSSEVGLRTIHSDPNHVELPSWRQEAATQPTPTPWSETNPANVPSRYASNVAAVPGKTLNSISTDRTQTTPAQRADWYRNYIETTYPGKDPNLGLGIAKAEGLNAPGIGPSRVDVDPQTGQPFSFGDFQYNMHPGALGSQALAAGLDPRDPNLWQQTGKWALDQIYGKNNVAPWKGDPVAAAYLKTGAAPPSMPPGSASPPPSGGRGPIGSDAVAGGTAGEKAPMTAGDWWNKLTTPGEGDKPSPLQTAVTGIGKALDPSQSDQGQGQGQGQGQQAQALQQQQAAAAYGAQRQQSLAANASQRMAQILAQGRKPLSWGSASPGGTRPGAGAGQLPSPLQAQSMPDELLAQLMQQGGSMGTSLNSTGDFYG